MLADLFLSVADAVFSYTIDKLDPAETLKTWLKRDPAKLAFQKALARAYTAFARRYPEYAASLFDQSFLSKEAVPEISKLLIRNQHPDPALLAQVWGRSIGFDIHSEFCKRATKPASDFLAWLEAELKGEQAFHALFDSRALDSLPRLEAEIEKLTNELTRGLTAALKIASEYEGITLSIGGDVKDSNVILGDGNQISVSNINNYYYSGVFDTLHDYYIPPDGVFQRVRVDEFVGRDWLTAKVDTFLNDSNRKSGAFLLIGEAGVGKTSFMAHLVKERRYLHLFAEQVAGEANVQRALQSLGSQLVTRYQIDPYKDRDTLTQLAVFPDFLERLLRISASTLANGEKIVIVCDALDEAGTFPDGNVFGLPNILPDGVYFILSQRPVNTKLPNIEPQRFDLEAQGSDNLQDMQTYLSAVAKRPEVAGQIRSKEYSEAFFIQTLKEKSLGVWMYLHYIIKEIESGSRAPLDLENLPAGLIGYYADYWDDWRYGRKGRGKGEDAWNNLYSHLLTTLAAAREAITVKQLIQWSNVKATPREVTQLLNQSWRSFITEKENGESKVYSPYHLSLRDFITGRVEFDELDFTRANLVRDLADQTVEAHQRIVDVFEEECKGEWERLVEQDYPRLHLSTHLAATGQYKKLTNLLTEGENHIQWAEARYKKEETYAGYLNDLTHLWKHVEKAHHYALAIRCTLIENSIHSLASNIEPELLAELAKAGLWSYARCLSTIRENSNSYTQAESLRLIAPKLRTELLPEALSAARDIKFEVARAEALSALLPHLSDELKPQALSAVQEIKDKFNRVETLANLASDLNDELKAEALQGALTTVHEIKSEYFRVSAMRALAPHLGENLKTQMLQEALSVARKIEHGPDRFNALVALVPNLNDELKTHVLQEALSLTHKIEPTSYRVTSLMDLIPSLNDGLRAKVLQEALAAAQEINVVSSRITAFADLLPHLDDELKTRVVQEALAAAQEINDVSSRVAAFANLVPHIGGELKARVLQEALAAAQEINDVSSRVAAFMDLMPHVNDELKAWALQDVLAAAREIEDESDRAHALGILAPHLNEELKTQMLQEALAASREINDGYARADALSALIPHLTDEYKAMALSAARAIKEQSPRVKALVALIPYLGDELKAITLVAAHEIKDAIFRIRIYEGLIPHLNEELKVLVFLELLEDAREIKDEHYPAIELVPLISHLNADLIMQALMYAREIKDEYDRADTLSAIVSRLSDELKTQTIQEALRAALVAAHAPDKIIQGGSLYRNGTSLSALAPYLSTDLITQVVMVAPEIKDEYSRANVLAALAPHLMNDKLKAMALAAAQEIKAEVAYARVLGALAPYLNEESRAQMLQEMFSNAREIKDEGTRANVLEVLAPYLVIDELKTLALAATREMKHGVTYAHALAAFMPYLNEELKAQLLQEAFAVAHEIEDESDRARALRILTPYLNESLITQALSAAREIEDEDTRADVLSALAPHLNAETGINILQEVLYLKNSSHNKIDEILSTWKEIEYKGLLEHIIPFVKFTAQYGRQDGIRIVATLIPALIHFAGTEIAGELLRAITDTARWWP